MGGYNRLPVRWEKTAILVMNEVRVNHPYLPDNVTGGPPPANERVRKVVNLVCLFQPSATKPFVNYVLSVLFVRRNVIRFARLL